MPIIMDMVVEMALGSNQCPWDWFRWQWLTIGIEIPNIFSTIAHVFGIGILLYKAMVCLE
jgi:hypothetical protein